MLNDRDSRVAERAAYAIGRFGVSAEPAIPALTQALGRGVGWAPHALAATRSAAAIAILKEAATSGNRAAGSLILMGPAGQRAFVEALAVTTTPMAFDGEFALPLMASRVDVSELVKKLTALASDETKVPDNRGIACTLLNRIPGQASLEVPVLRKPANDYPEFIRWRCGGARDYFRRLVDHPTAVGSTARLQSPGSGPSPWPDGVASARWAAAIAKDWGDRYVSARIIPMDAASISRRIERVASIGASKTGYLTLGKAFDWSLGITGASLRPTAEVFYDLSDGQHIDTDGVPFTSAAVKSLSSITPRMFEVTGVAGLIFVGGLVYDDQFTPVFVVYIPREALERFRGGFDLKTLSRGLPPEYIGVARPFKNDWDATVSMPPPLDDSSIYRR